MVNPSTINPDPIAILRDLNRVTDRNRPGAIRDNLVIVDGNNRGTPGWPSNAEYNASIGRSFQFTDQNLNEAMARAAREGKPLVMVFGSMNTRDTRGLLDNVIPAARNNTDAIFVYVDRSRLNPNSELGRFAQRELGNTNWAYTGIFTVRPGSNGEPQLDGNPVANTWGARNDIAGIIQTQVGYARGAMDARRGQFNIPTDSRPGTTPPPGTTPTDRGPARPGQVTPPGQVVPPGSDRGPVRPGQVNPPGTDRGPQV
ncbi:MAG: hypothetical protein K2Z81_11900, partial [Cyanobacteria bacterium]|nr:hypothetical protein [Cyanobacteriota bacterium]